MKPLCPEGGGLAVALMTPTGPRVWLQEEAGVMGKVQVTTGSWGTERMGRDLGPEVPSFARSGIHPGHPVSYGLICHGLHSFILPSTHLFIQAIIMIVGTEGKPC